MNKMNKKIVFATNNEHKLKELREIVGDQFTIVSLKEIGCHEEIIEDADTLEGNALIKAEFVYNKYHLNCFADDTGLEVEALDNAPGIYTARYAGEACSNEDNMAKLLQKLEGILNRKAKFRTVIALIYKGKKTLFNGVVNGKILNEKRGAQGFGYDPIFRPNGYDKAFAELGDEIKNKISHRAKATQQLISHLREL